MALQTISANELNRQVAINITRTIMSRDYSKLALFMEIMAKSTDNLDIVLKLREIKEGCPFPFEIYCQLYQKSFFMPANRGIRFAGTGQKILWPNINRMATSDFVEPMNDLAIELMSRLSYSNLNILKQLVTDLNANAPKPTTPELVE